MLRVCVLIAVLLTCGGCYHSKQPIFPIEGSTIIPVKSGTYECVIGDGKTTGDVIIEKLPNDSMQYRFTLLKQGIGEIDLDYFWRNVNGVRGFHHLAGEYYASTIFYVYSLEKPVWFATELVRITESSITFFLIKKDEDKTFPGRKEAALATLRGAELTRGEGVYGDLLYLLGDVEKSRQFIEGVGRALHEKVLTHEMTWVQTGCHAK